MIDHLVLATPDVAAAAAAVHDGWGVEVVIGGRHVGLGTCNRLTGLGGGAYLEVVGPDDTQPEPPVARPFGIDELVETQLVTWCARPTRPLGEVSAGLSHLGIDTGPVMAMSRVRPDGVVLEWQLTDPLLHAPHHGTVPFLIDWLASPHPTGSLPADAVLRTLRLHHPQPDLLTAALAVIGADERIEVADGEPSITAVVDTPMGVVVL